MDISTSTWLVQALDLRVGEQIQAHRETRDWTVTQLAERAGLGTAHLSAIECGRIMPRTRTLIDLARALGQPLVIGPQVEHHRPRPRRTGKIRQRYLDRRPPPEGGPWITCLNLSLEFGLTAQYVAKVLKRAGVQRHKGVNDRHPQGSYFVADEARAILNQRQTYPDHVRNMQRRRQKKRERTT